MVADIAQKVDPFEEADDDTGVCVHGEVLGRCCWEGDADGC